MESGWNHQLPITEQKEDDDVVETDPTGRFERYRKSLGRGAYKEVFKAYDQEEGVEVAWNQIRLDSFMTADVTRMHNEIKILENLRNENIINLLYSWRARSQFNEKDGIYFITELMTSGTLKGYIRKTKGLIKPKIIRNWSRQILNGLHYLHTRDPPIIHRDLKCDNIFINGNNGQAKIGDLGLAAIKATHHLSSVLGTPEFMAPELYDEEYDEKVDIYAYGMVILEIATKEYPYSECSNQAQIYKKVSNGIKPAALLKVQDPEIRAFIELCIEHDPKRRPSAAELLLYPFFSQLSSHGSATDLSAVDHSPVSTLPIETSGGQDGHFFPMQGVIDSDHHHFLISRQATPMKQTPTCEVEVIEPILNDEVNLKMTYHTGTSSCEIKFPFNLSIDTATDVVSELVRENLIMAIDEQLTRRRIEEAIRSILINQRWVSSMSASVTSDTVASEIINLDVDQFLDATVATESQIGFEKSSGFVDSQNPFVIQRSMSVPASTLSEPRLIRPASVPNSSTDPAAIRKNQELVEKLTLLQELNLKNFDDSRKLLKSEKPLENYQDTHKTLN